jgi:micrococcal nuclease
MRVGGNRQRRRSARAAVARVAAVAAAGVLTACATGEVSSAPVASPATEDRPATTDPDRGPSRSTTTEHQVGGERLAVVGSITDGDTFRTEGGERVRLIGVDTPEPDQDACFAAEATAALAGMIPPGTPVRLVADVDPVDRYGRTLAYVYRDGDGLFVNRELAAIGVAVQLTVAPNVAMAEEIGAAVAEAREAGRGLWSGCPSEAPPTTPPPTTAPPATAPPPPVPAVPQTSAPTTAPPAGAGCHPSYPDVCIPPAPPDLDCPQIPYRRFRVVGADPHGFDGDHDGIGCESG